MLTVNQCVMTLGVQLFFMFYGELPFGKRSAGGGGGGCSLSRFIIATAPSV